MIVARRQPSVNKPPAMNQPVPQPRPESPAASTPKRPEASASVPATGHPVLSRLIEEVRNEADVGSGYDRVHNRHNRGSL